MIYKLTDKITPNQEKLMGIPRGTPMTAHLYFPDGDVSSSKLFETIVNCAYELSPYEEKSDASITLEDISSKLTYESSPLTHKVKSYTTKVGNLLSLKDKKNIPSREPFRLNIQEYGAVPLWVNISQDSSDSTKYSLNILSFEQHVAPAKQLLDLLEERL